MSITSSSSASIVPKQKWHCFSSVPFSDAIPNRWIIVVGKITSGAGKAPTVYILVSDVDVFKRIISKDWTGGLCVLRGIIYVFIYM